MGSTKTNLKVTSGGGATSCLSVRLHDACGVFQQNGFWPDSIDSSEQFQMFQTQDRIDFSKHVYGEYKKPGPELFINFNHGWQYGWFNSYDLPLLSQLAGKVCRLSDAILDRSFEFWNRMQGRAGVLYRGNDKALEVPRVQYERMLEMAHDSGQQSWIVQTDELEFFQFWKIHFPDTIRIKEIPMISKNPDAYVMGDNPSQFLIDFLAALKALSMAPVLLTTTGNTGLWLALFRGDIKGIYQAWGGQPTYRKY